MQLLMVHSEADFSEMFQGLTTGVTNPYQVCFSDFR